MSKTIKSMMSESLSSRYAGIAEAGVVNVMGLNVAETIKFRREVASKQMRVNVVKNSVARRAFAGGPLEALGRSLEGPCALVTGGKSVIDVAREMTALAKKYPKVELKFGLLAGEREVMALSDIAKLKSLGELKSDISMLIGSTGRRLAGCVAGPQSRLAGCIKAIADKEAA
ncbi:MAG: 50S ribosomal protein L10 [Phycisphaerales bacterium]|nr:50S ribosomal protein L10 [Phycisphaerales bacterium]